MEVTREHGLLDVSLPKHVKESEFLPGALFRPSNAALVLSSFEIGIQRDGSRYKRSLSGTERCTCVRHHQADKSQLRTFQHFYYPKKKIITLTTYPRKKKA